MLLILAGLQRYLSPGVTAAGGRQHRQSRTHSVIPLIRGILLVVIGVVGVLAVFSKAGIDIALGLGAQSLLRDILAGVFFVAEDSFRIGEYVEIGQLRGTVERISLRSMKVRHRRGAPHTIPYGQIPSITKNSRDWVIVKFELLAPHDTDVLKLKRVVREVSAEINQAPEFQPYLIEPLKSRGVDNVDLFGLTVRLKFKAPPGEQFTMRREMLRRLTAAFRRNGIVLARRSVQVESAEGAPIGAAAADVDEDAPASDKHGQ